MSIARLNGDLLNQLIYEVFPKGIGDLQSRWDADEGPDRSTLYRWRKGSLPNSSSNYLRLCGLLNVDPFLLLDVERDKLSILLDRLTEASLLESRWPYPALRFAVKFFGRRRRWPPVDMLLPFYTKLAWHLKEFTHAGAREGVRYQGIDLSGTDNSTNARQVFHFAFRHPSLFGRRWLQYGIVRRIGQTVELIHINGYNAKTVLSNEKEPSRVETYFGHGPADFRIASLHSFNHRLVEAEPSDCGRLRFPA